MICIRCKWPGRSARTLNAARNADTTCLCWLKQFTYWKRMGVCLRRIVRINYLHNIAALGKHISKVTGCCCGNKMTWSWYYSSPAREHIQISFKEFPTNNLYFFAWHERDLVSDFFMCFSLCSNSYWVFGIGFACAHKIKYSALNRTYNDWETNIDIVKNK